MAIGSKKETRTPRERRKLRIRKLIDGTEARPRLTVFKSSKHTYVQAICDVTGKTLVSASTRDKEVIDQVSKIASDHKSKAKDAEGPVAARDAKSTKSVNAAQAVGMILAKRAIDRKIEYVTFDRNGFLYTGRVKAVADGARLGGLKF